MICVLPSLLLLCSPNSATVTYSNPAARMERLLPELSKSCGETLVPSDGMKNVIAVVRFDHAPIKEALAKLATATRGVWVEDRGALELVEDADSIQREQTKVLDEQRKRILDGLDAIESGKPDPSESKYGDLPERMAASEAPMKRLLQAMLPYLDKDALASDAHGDRTVYSSSPKPLQRSLLEAAWVAVPVYVAAYNRIPADSRDQTPDRIHGEVAKADLIVNGGRSSGVEFRLVLYDGVGLQIAQDDLQVGSRQWGDMVDGEEMIGGYRAGAKPPPEPPLKISPQLKRIFEIWKQGAGDLTPAELDRLMHPVEHDPLETLGGVLVAYAEFTKSQLAVSLTDVQSTWAAYDLARVTQREVETIVEDRLHAKPVDGWIVGKRSIATAETDLSYTTDRNKLTAMLVEITDDQNPDLKALIRLDRLGISSLGGLPQAALFPGLMKAQNGFAVDRLADLSDGEIDALLAGKKLPLASTPPAFQAAFREDARENFRMGLTVADQPAAPPGADFDWTPPSDYRSEFTEIADAPIPSTAYVQLTDAVSDAVQRVPSTRPSQGTFDNVSMFDRDRGTIDDLALALATEGKASKYRLGKQHDYHLRIYVIPGVYTEDETRTYEFPEDGPWLTPDQFPKEIKARFLKLYNGYMKDETKQDDNPPK